MSSKIEKVHRKWGKLRPLRRGRKTRTGTGTNAEAGTKTKREEGRRGDDRRGEDSSN